MHLTIDVMSFPTALTSFPKQGTHEVLAEGARHPYVGQDAG